MSSKIITDYYVSQKPIKIINHQNSVIMSFNIRCVSNNDTGFHDYKVRMPYIREVLEKENPDIIALQEVRPPQAKYLFKILKPYNYVFKYRDDTDNSEANPIFFKKDCFILKEKNTFWLSKTYRTMSNTFNGSCFRICSYVRLKDKKSNQEFYIFNAHLDHKNPEARFKSIKLINKVIKSLKIKIPYLIVGDMNDHYCSETINELFSNHVDASKFNHQQNEITFHNYGRDKQKIDYIALSKNIKQLDYKVIKTQFKNIYPSDHYPIEVTIKF